jgi:hypothetical protein
MYMVRYYDFADIPAGSNSLLKDSILNRLFKNVQM